MFKRHIITFRYVMLDVKFDLATKWERHQLKINRFSVARQDEMRRRERKEKSRKISNGRRHGTHYDLHAQKTTEVVETARVQNVFLRLGRKKENYSHVCKNENV